MKLLYLLPIIIVFFLGCSSKNTAKPDLLLEHNSSHVVDCADGCEVDDDEIFDEFEDETKLTEIYDPLIGYNRFMTSFNDGLYEYILTPAVKGYDFIVHKEIRIGIAKMFKNIYYPPRLVNNILQGKFKNATEETGRFAINSTIGILGFFDPAKSYFNLEAHKEDFGQTLGFYGVGAGPHIVLPLWGPSNLRDTIGIFPDSYFGLIDYKSRNWYTMTDTWAAYLSIKAAQQVNEFSLYRKTYEKLKKDSIDLYPFLRDLYEQHRESMIKE